MNILFNRTLLLFGIVCLSFLLRVYRLDLLPLYTDETGGHYIHYWLFSMSSIFPHFFFWLLSASVTYTWILGLTEWGARIPSALYSSMFVVVMYWATRSIQIFSDNKRNDWSSLISALLVGILPWAFMLGRIGHSYIPLMLIAFMLAVGFMLRQRFVLACLFLLVAAYFYPSLLLLSFLLMLLMIFDIYLRFTSLPWRWVIVMFIGSISLFFFFFVKYSGISTTSRLAELALWNNVNVTADTNLYRGIARESEPSVFSLGMDPEVLGNKLFYNTAVAVFREFGERYWSFWDVDWLFLKGDPILRHSTGMVGMFWWWTAPFMILGAGYFFMRARFFERILIGILLLGTPLSAAITSDGAGYLLRVVTMLPILTYFVGTGIVKGYHYIKIKYTHPHSGQARMTDHLLRSIYVLLVCVLFLSSSWYFYYGYFHVYPTLAAESFEDGWKELALWQQARNDAPMLVIWQGHHGDSAFRFWQKTAVENYTPGRAEITRVGESHFYRTFDNLYFGWPARVEDLQSFLMMHPDISYIAWPSDYRTLYATYEDVGGDTVNWIDGVYRKRAFEVTGVSVDVDEHREK